MPKEINRFDLARKITEEISASYFKELNKISLKLLIAILKNYAKRNKKEN